MTRKDAITGWLSPGSAHAEAGRAPRRRAEIVAGVVLVTLALTVIVGWWSVPGESSLAAASEPHPGTDQLTYTAVTVSGESGTVTALILGCMIIGASLIGLFFFSPTPAPEIPRRPRRSGAVEVILFMRLAYSSIAPGAVLETDIRNSALLLDFFNRSISRSMA